MRSQSKLLKDIVESLPTRQTITSFLTPIKTLTSGNNVTIPGNPSISRTLLWTNTNQPNHKNGVLINNIFYTKSH